MTPAKPVKMPKIPFRPADNAKAARQRRNGRKAVANPRVRQKFERA